MYRRLSIKWHGVELDVEGEYIPETKSCVYRKNGDPGEPCESATFEVTTVLIENQDMTEIFAESKILKNGREVYLLPEIEEAVLAEIEKEIQDEAQ